LNNLVYREIHLQSIDLKGIQALQDHSRRTQETAGISSHNTAALTVIIFDSNSESTAAPPEPAI
jgi:hypothetical protein